MLNEANDKGGDGKLNDLNPPPPILTGPNCTKFDKHSRGCEAIHPPSVK